MTYATGWDQLKFTLKHKHLSELAAANEFPISKTEMVFFGFRGCLPIAPFDQQMKSQHDLILTLLNYVNPQCTFAQWHEVNPEFALFPGSTIPMKSLVETLKGKGVNELLTGYHRFRKGSHIPKDPNRAHLAWKQFGDRPVRRTFTDAVFDGSDMVDVTNAHDNLHAAWCDDVVETKGRKATYSSAGCQVVVGFPKCKKRGDTSQDTGPWKIFRSRGYAADQSEFGYVLVSAIDVHRIARAGASGLEAVRFGSQGERAKRVQTALKVAKPSGPNSDPTYYEGDADGNFTGASIRALIEFQRDRLGPDKADGVCRADTARALGIPWP